MESCLSCVFCLYVFYVDLFFSKDPDGLLTHLYRFGLTLRIRDFIVRNQLSSHREEGSSKGGHSVIIIVFVDCK